ncbi:MAG: CRISPR-associated ring nuclease Csm6 [Gammaproteobacteria bacterium]|nr:CRISPR-associated ring nuclease Csm6 [Gammaproteobacteria bacterium]
MKNILVCVSGLSPQIVTETLYALAMDKNDPVVVDEVHILTTVTGKKKIEELLLTPKTGQFFQLCDQYPQLVADNICFNAETIHVISDKEGNDLDDIRTIEDNGRLADETVDLMRRLTAETKDGQPLNRIHASIAGGRKTMGFFLGHAMTLFAHRDDRLSHVLVTKGFESHREFFFPPIENKTLESKDFQTNEVEIIETRDAEVMLADIPFVRLRGAVMKKSGSVFGKKMGYEETVQVAQADFDAVDIKFDWDKKEVFLSGKKVEMKPIDFTFYYWLSKRKKNGVACEWREHGAEDIEFLDAVYANLKSSDTYVSDELCETKVDKRNLREKVKLVVIKSKSFEQRKNGIKTAVEKVLGLNGAAPYVIGDFGLTVEPNNIDLGNGL